MITIRDIVQYYAQYNLNANTRMIAIISDMCQGRFKFSGFSRFGSSGF